MSEEETTKVTISKNGEVISQKKVPDKELAKEIVPIQTLSSDAMIASADNHDIERAVEKAEKHVKLQRRLMEVVLNATNHKDWIDQSGTPYLEASGAKKIRLCVGCDISNVMYERVDYPDDPNGAYFVYEVVGDIKWNGQTVPETGSGSSRDAFFAKRKGKLLPMSEVDVQNIRKKALTNFWNRAIKSILGLSFTWEEVEDITNGKITRSKCTSVSYNKNKGKSSTKSSDPDIEKKRDLIKSMMLQMYGKEQAPIKLEQNTSFTDKTTGKEIPGKKTVKALSDKQVIFVHKGLSTAFKKWQEEGAYVSTDDPTGTEPKNDRVKSKEERDALNKAIDDLPF